MPVKTRYVDPEPLSIYLAIVATMSGTIALVNLIESHWPQPLPTQARAQLLGGLAPLDDQCRHLRADAQILRDLFTNAQYPDGRFIPLRSGARLSPADFERYERVSDDVYRRLRELNRLCNRLEKRALRGGDLPIELDVNRLGELHARLDALVNARTLSTPEGWQQVEDLIQTVQQVIAALRRQFGL